jgi:hypothetical protein
VVIVGRNKGLSHAAVRRFMDDYAPANKLTATFVDPAEAATLRGSSPEPAVRASGLLCTLRLTSADGASTLLYLYNSTGTKPGELKLPPHLDGVLYSIDLHREGLEPFPRTIFQGTRFAMPLALAVSTGPDEPEVHGLDGFYASSAVAAQEAERDSAAVRLMLVQKDLGDFANALEARFQRVAYFRIAPQAATTGALAPLVWLAYHVGALRDEPGAYVAVVNLLRYVRRALHGREGRQAWNTTWGLVVFGTPIALALLGWKLGFWLPALCLLTGVTGLLWNSTRRRA